MIGKSVRVLTPMYGGVLTTNYHDSFLRLFLMCAQSHVPFTWSTIYNESLITRARNRLIDTFLKQGNDTHAVFIDADIGFDPEAVLSMVESDFDIVGVPCPKKSLRWDRMQRAVRRSKRDLKPEELARISGDFVVNFLPGQDAAHVSVDQPIEVQSLGTGLLVIHRRVFEKYRETFPDRWYYPKHDVVATSRSGQPVVGPAAGPVWDFFQVRVDPSTREYLSEDYAFVTDCRSMGFKVMMLPWVRTTHMGSYVFVGDMPAAAFLAGEL